MNFEGQIESICEHCGKPYMRWRITSKFCSDRCRVRNHRWKDASVATPFVHIAELIQHIGHMTEGELSFQAISALKTIQDLARYQDISSPSSWWRCSKCWKAVQKSLPEDKDCACGNVSIAEWRLQKKML